MTQQESKNMTQPTAMEYHQRQHTATIAARLPTTLKSQFYAACTEHGTNANQTLIALVREYIQQQKNDK